MAACSLQITLSLQETRQRELESAPFSISRVALRPGPEQVAMLLASQVLLCLPAGSQLGGGIPVQWGALQSTQGVHTQ